MIEIVEHHPGWAAQFQDIAQQLHQALGPRALRVDHIGSTAVAGLCAKDVIDVQATVPALDDEVVQAMSRAGFVRHPGGHSDHVPPGADPAPQHWTKLLFKNPAGRRPAHIHVRRRDAANQRYALLFRDYLRAHPPMAAAYGELKRRLAARLAQAEDYPVVKDPAVDLIYLAAEEWAERTRWQPAPCL